MTDYLNEVTHSMLSCKRTGLEFNIVIEDTGSVANFDKSVPKVSICLPTGNITVSISDNPCILSGYDLISDKYKKQIDNCLMYISCTSNILLKYYMYCGEDYSTFDMIYDLHRLGYYNM